MRKTPSTPRDAGAQLVVNQCVAQVIFYLDHQHAAGRTADEITQERDVLVAAITEALRARQATR
jgi:hypothetical protein